MSASEAPGVSPLDAAALAGIESAALAAVAAASDLDALHAARVAHAGDRSPIALANRGIANVDASQKKEAGQRVGAVRAAINTAVTARQEELERERDVRALAEETVDVTLPWDRWPYGARHPLTTTGERIVDVFVAMGYEVAEGPEVEAEWFNFDALNMPPDHPARSMMDTFFVESPDSGLVLRTHTSPVQARTLLSRKPPVYVVVPGRVFRTDELDATHSPVFNQVEGLVVDEGITMAHLRGTLDHLATVMFGAGLRTRWRPSYFPFTEPSAEFDVECFACRGKSVGNPDHACRVCSSEGWIEWGGCGIVNPRVLIACGVDPERYTGFAFGMGVERALQFRHGAEDMRDMIEGDVRYSLPFGLDV